MRHDLIKRMEGVAARVGWQKIAEELLDDMTVTKLSKLVDRLAFLNETPEGFAVAEMAKQVGETEARATVELLVKARIPYVDGRQLLGHCTSLRRAQKQSA